MGALLDIRVQMASKVWNKEEYEALRKCKEVPFTGKVLATVLWDSWRILLIEYLPQGIYPETGKKYTVDQQQYFDTILCLGDTIKSKWRSLLSKNLVLLHNNAQLHTTALIEALITSLKWNTFPYLAYSSDLAPSNFWVFPGLKEF